MTLWSPVFAVGALCAAFFGFGGAPGPAEGFAQILFFICLIALMASFVLASARSPSRQ